MIDFNQIEPMLLNPKDDEDSSKAKVALKACLLQRYLRSLSNLYGFSEDEARNVILQTYADVTTTYNAEKARKYGPLSRYISIAIKGDARDMLDKKRRYVIEVPTLDTRVSEDSDTTKLDMMMDKTTANIAEDIVLANVLRQYEGNRIDFAASIILMNMRLQGNLSRLPSKHLSRDERMTAHQLPSMRVCLTNEVMLFIAELLGIDWVVNKSRLAKAMDGGFVRYVTVNPPAYPMTLRDMLSIQLRKECGNLPIANNICAAYLNIPNATYCEHHQKYHRVVWQNSKKDLDAQLRE